MGKINAGRVVLGGLVAGLIIDLGEWLASLVFAEQYEAMFETMGLGEPSTAGMLLLTLFGFLIGILMAWLYAAMRPRFGPGPRTALYAGCAVWFMGWFWPTVSGAAMGFYQMDITMWVIVIVWSLVEVALAALAGGWLYQENGAAAAPAAPASGIPPTAP
jgi:hypothetical protein